MISFSDIREMKRASSCWGSAAPIMMMDPIGRRVLGYAVICNFILWAVLTFLLVLIVR
jgi:hypothetical protein